MTTTRLQKIALAAAGCTALGIGVFILLAPQMFYAGYGIAVESSPSLLSELRAPAACLAALGIVILAGVVRPAWTEVSSVVALTVFLAFPAGRLVSLVADGMPSGSVIGALVVELAIGALCIVAFAGRRNRATSGTHRYPLGEKTRDSYSSGPPVSRYR